MYVLFAKSGNEIVTGSRLFCCHWAKAQIESDQSLVVKIFKARPSDKDARIICEVTYEGFQPIVDGTPCSLHYLKKRAK